MLSGLKFIPRDQLDKAGDEDVDGFQRREKKRKGKDRSKKRSPWYDKDEAGKIKKNSRKKKWYSSDEESTSASESGSESDSNADEKSCKHRKKEKKSHRNNSKAKEKLRNKQSELSSQNKNNTMRKELGLDWMLRPKDEVDKKIATPTDQLVEPKVEEKQNPRELNPYFKNSGTGYPEEAGESNKIPRNRIMSNAIVGDGGASWRLKALKRAQEQAAREGKNLNEVVEERWGSVGQLSVSLASKRAAPSRAHLHAIKNRQKGVAEEQQTDTDGQVEKGSGGVSRNRKQQTDTDDQNVKSYEKGSGGPSKYSVSRRYTEAKVPKVQDSLSWGKRKGNAMSSESSKILSTAITSINKFANDGSFMSEITRQQNDGSVRSLSEDFESKIEREMVPSDVKQPSESTELEGLSANQLAAKALQLRLKGKNDEADKFMREVENIKAKQVAGDESSRQNENHSRRYTSHETPIRQRRNEDDGDANLAQKITQNKKYSMSTQADDEYDYEDGPRKKSRKKDANMNKSNNEKASFPKRILTQQERCKFCFENPFRPKHLVLSIANLTYLSLPHWQSIVPGHCCILTLQHESATRALDNNVWDEIRNFKKCLIMMFAKQERDVVFLETVMGLAQQKRHCLVEVIPLSRTKASAAPLYFKKAIDEAEDEWSQHNAKKLIDTSQKGLRGSIPKNFPYFHVEFGLNKGFVHVIDDETSFKSNFGINVIRGMLQLPEEDMHGHTKPDSIESQKQAVASFAKDWEVFDWTKQLD